MTANSSQIAYLNASLLDTSPASHPFHHSVLLLHFKAYFT